MRWLRGGTMPQPLIIAVPKGRILAEVLPLMARAGIVPEPGMARRRSALSGPT
jgi:ATP phosphoribosyltransferase